MKFFIYFSLISCVVFHISVEASSNLLIRNKRVIDKNCIEGSRVCLSRARYIVHIQRNRKPFCSGSILEADIIITIPYCIAESSAAFYTIFSNSRLRDGGTPHHIRRRSTEAFYGFVVFRITPPIELQHGLNEKIDLFLGEIPPLSSAFFTGWGCNSLDHRNGHTFPDQLMQTKLPLISREECGEYYGGPILDQQICTFDKTQRRTPCLGDEGGPLVYNNRLLGILLFKGYPIWRRPDIFFNFNNFFIHNIVNHHVHMLQVFQ